jgi:putative chitobiose transport system permease protein
MKEQKYKLPRVLIPYLFLAPALLLLILTVFLPALQSFSLSFTHYNYNLTETPQWIGFANFQKMLQDRIFWKTLLNTILILLLVVPVLVFLSLALAILINRKLQGINWFRLAYYTPVIISIVVVGIAWKAIYSSQGVLNQLLQNFFHINIPWLTSPNWAIWSVMLVTIWKGLGYYMVIYLAGLQSISPELYEAAALDGSDGLLKHWDITLPLMRPYLILVAVISAISATKTFEEVYILTQGGPYNSSKTIVYYIYEKAFRELEVNYACTMGLVLFLIILILSILNLKLANSQ